MNGYTQKWATLRLTVSTSELPEVLAGELLDFARALRQKELRHFDGQSLSLANALASRAVFFAPGKPIGAFSYLDFYA
jgi:hypothetical protein